MILQAYKTIEDINGSGIEGVFQTAAEATNALVPLILAAIFFILAFGSYYIMQRRFGEGDLPACLTVSGLVVVLCALLMSMIPNFINIPTITITIVLEIIFFFWLVLSRV
jgi:hypothetical protein